MVQLPPDIDDDASVSEKGLLLPSAEVPTPNLPGGRERPRRRPLHPLLLATLAAIAYIFSSVSDADSFSQSEPFSPVCPDQVGPLRPRLAFDIPATYANESAGRLSEAVKIPTISYDDNGPPTEDDRWTVFYTFHSWLGDTFSDVFDRPEVTLTKVNTFALVTEIKGSEPSLKPLMLTSHMDVVPVPEATRHRWTHPPFDGVFDGEFVWGRGAADDKTLLVAHYEALSLLFKQGWVPRRSIVLAHGFDEEEVVARQGAGNISPYLEEKYGRDSMLMIIDEGGSGQRFFGTAFAAPATGEKGYLDVEISVATLGGHSSVPPLHTGIGIMSQLVHALEKEPYEPGFAGSDDPMLQYAVCASLHAEHFPSRWRSLIKKGKWKKLAQEFANVSSASKAVISTTQAIDVITGGVKVNALPELVTAVMNHRIAYGHSVAYVKQHLAAVLAPIATRNGLAFHPFNASSTSPFSTSQDATARLGSSYVQLEVQGLPLEPAPKTPTHGGVWELFSGSLRAVYKDEQNGGKQYIVSPFTPTGNTDTKVYWNLTRNIFRWMGGPVTDYASNVHTVDEKTSLKSHLTVLEWLHTIIQNADAYIDEQ